MERYLQSGFMTRIITFFILSCSCFGYLFSEVELFAYTGMNKFELYNRKTDEVSLSLGPRWALYGFDESNYLTTTGYLSFSPSMQKYQDDRQRSGANRFSGNVDFESKLFFANDIFIGVNANFDFDNKNTVDFPMIAYNNAEGEFVDAYFCAVSNSYLEIGFLGIDSQKKPEDDENFLLGDRMFGISIGLGGWYYSRWMSGNIYPANVEQATSAVFHTGFESNFHYTLGSTGGIYGFYDKVLGDGYRFQVEMLNLFPLAERFFLSTSVLYNIGTWKASDIDVEWKQAKLRGQGSYIVGFGAMVFAGVTADIDRGMSFNMGFRYSPSEVFTSFLTPDVDIFDHLYYEK